MVEAIGYPTVYVYFSLSAPVNAQGTQDRLVREPDARVSVPIPEEHAGHQLGAGNSTHVGPRRCKWWVQAHILQYIPPQRVPRYGGDDIVGQLIDMISVGDVVLQGQDDLRVTVVERTQKLMVQIAVQTPRSCIST